MATKCAGIILVVLVTLAAVSYDAQATAPQNPGVIPPDGSYLGLTYGEWAARWWQAAFAIPVVDGEHPTLTGGAFGGQEGILFLAAVVGEPRIVEVEIPSGTALFFPVINAECSEIESDPFHGEDEKSLRSCARHHIENTSGRSAEIDGRRVKTLNAYRVESPLFEFGPLPENNLLGAPEGETSDSVDAGVYLLLEPLSVGQHVVRVRGTFDEFGVSIDTTFIITVVP
jgi:hypothetical protein